uniref:Uncharacterized protein n=1 Tax=viral metagenome TaxID=1070528 RepID=A0A6M3J2Y5_9ZZZZ
MATDCCIICGNPVEDPTTTPIPAPCCDRCAWDRVFATRTRRAARFARNWDRREPGPGCRRTEDRFAAAVPR